MTPTSSRREFMLSAAGAAIAVTALDQDGTCVAGAAQAARPGVLKLGLVTYLLAKEWDIETIIKNCSETGFEGVELRTTHAHGVEPSLSGARRGEVRKRFEDSPVDLASLGTAFEFHQVEKAKRREHIEGAKEFAQLAADVGARGIKVRPNGLQTKRGIPAETTLEQIGKSMAEVAASAANVGVGVRCEVHGSETKLLPNMAKILDYADHENVSACWNSNPTDLDGGGLEANFALVAGRIGFVHMRDLYDEAYPYRLLFELLKESGYAGYCCAEIPASSDPVRVMNYFRAMFYELQRK